ncbi:MAG: MFS transporter, partial [Lentisphaerae bacterium]|nr:MFS transporter [Lentisphaerota bacterium]
MPAENPRPVRNLRWSIAVLLLLSTAVNYLDRNTLSALA